MYRRLEAKPEKVQGKDSNSEAECKCTCGTEKATDGDKTPAADFATNRMRDYFKING